MIMICNVPDEVVESVKMGTWCGSSVAEKMIANGIPLDKIRAEIIAIAINGQVDAHTMFIRTGEQVKQIALEIIDKYKGEME